MGTLHAAIRYDDKLVKKYLEDGQIKEIRHDDLKFADLTGYEGTAHYFFSIVPKELKFFNDMNISAVILKTDNNYQLAISAIAYKMFLLSLIENHDNNYRYDLEWSYEIEEKIKNELQAFSVLRIILRSSKYYSGEEYNEFSGFYSY